MITRRSLRAAAAPYVSRAPATVFAEHGSTHRMRTR